MQVIKLKNLSKKDYQRIIRRSFGTNEAIASQVKKIINKVKKGGDRTILAKYQKRYGKKNYQSIKVTQREIRQAYKNVDKKLVFCLKQMVKNITLVHKAQLPDKKDTVVCPEDGIFIWRVWRPIEKVGLYIPGGKAIYPSSVLMCAIPAQIAGVADIIMCSPPRDDGQIPSPTLVAANLIGLTKIYKVGGVEAIAAMAYGTYTIPSVYKIFGAGNLYVTAAKMTVFGKVAIDMPAGPSEIAIIADSYANPAYVAADLLVDCEHGPDSACVLVTNSTKVAIETVKEIEKQLKTLGTGNYIKQALNTYGLLAVVDSLDEAISFTNMYAPEHLTIMTKKPENILPKIKNAGSVFLGSYTSKSSGDYATGANHVLPTGGSAKMYPPLSVDSFGKWMQVQKCTKKGLLQIRDTVETLSEVEQLPAHKRATNIRFPKAPKRG